MKTYTIKPLEWAVDHLGNATAHTILGSIFVSRRSGSWWEWGYCFDEYYDEGQSSCDDKDDGIAKATAFYLDRILPCLNPTTPPKEQTE